MATKFLGGLEVSGVLTAPTPSTSDNSTKIATTAFVKAQGYLSGAHTHSISDVTGLQSALDGKAAVGSFAAVNHTHTISNITGLQSALDSKQPAGSYLTEIPEEYLTQPEADGLYQPVGSYAAASHTHSISQVTGLQSALDGKASTSHNHDSLYWRKSTLETQNPVGTTYGNGVAATPPYFIGQATGDNDGWKIYGEAPATNSVKMIFEIVDDIESGDTWVFRNKRTYSPYDASEPFVIEGNGNIRAAGTISASGYNKSNWDTAYGWGNHAGLYAAASHTHTISQITGLQSALDGKQAAGSYAAASHSHGIEAITDAERWWNNFGQNHSTRTSFDAQGSALSTGFGWRYVQGAGNSPNWGNTGNGQYYALSVGLGNDYASNNYAMQIAIPRLGVNPYLSLRFEEGGSLGAWTKISAAYADSAGEVAWSGVTGKPSTFTPSTHTHSISDVTGLQSALDGKAAASHTHAYVATNGSTWTPHPSSTRDAAWNTFYTDYGYISFGPANGSWAHIYSDKNFYFNQEIYVNNNRLIRWNEAGVGVAANAIVQRDSNGYIYANHINFSTSESENPSINSFIVSNGDGWSRKATIGHVQSQLGLGSAAYKSVGDFAAATHYHDYATHRGEGTNFVDYARYVYNNGAYSGSGWTEPSDLGVRYAASAGNADSVGGLGAGSFLRDDGWNSYPGQDANTQGTMRSDFTYSNNAPWVGEVIRFGASGYSLQLNSAYGSSELSFRTNNGDYGTSWNTWRTLIHNGNITNFAAAPAHLHSIGEVIGLQSALDGKAAASHTHLWGHITDRPTNLSQFNNNSGFITSSGRAYPRRADGEDINWNWSGQGGQPTWLWGGWDGREMYVFNPSNFEVSYATSAGNANYANSSGYSSGAGVASNVNNGNAMTDGANYYIKYTGTEYLRFHHNGSTGVFDSRYEFNFRNTATLWYAQRIVHNGYMSFVWFDVDPWGDNWGIGSNPTSWKMVNRGSLLTFGFEDWSDRRHKSAIVEIDNAIEKVCSISGYTYWKVGSEVREGGVIAQDVLAVFPEAVGGTEEGYSVKPAALIGLLMKAVKEQQEQISILQQRIELLENK